MKAARLEGRRVVDRKTGRAGLVERVVRDPHWWTAVVLFDSGERLAVPYLDLKREVKS